MVEMRMENERVDRHRAVGDRWIQAITRGTLDVLGTCCLAEVHSRLLSPSRFVTLDTAEDLVAKFYGWFGECSNFQVEHSRVEQVGGRLAIFYRFRLREKGEWFIVEQQLYCTLQDDRIARLDLLCSGFQLVEQGDDEALLTSRKAGKGQEEYQLLEMFSTAGSTESTCALLTPAIKTKLRAMESGQVMEVRVDDLSARGDIEAWCRLSGNQLLRVSEGEGDTLRFFVQKK